MHAPGEVRTMGASCHRPYPPPQSKQKESRGVPGVTPALRERCGARAVEAGLQLLSARVVPQVTLTGTSQLTGVQAGQLCAPVTCSLYIQHEKRDVGCL